MLRRLAGMVRSRQVSARELVARSLERIERDDPKLNAVVALRAEEALTEAEALDERLGLGEPTALELPLAGVPLLVKDVHDLEGTRTTIGSLLLADAAPAARDCAHVARLRAAGAIAVGKTNCPEFCFEGYTDNRLFGATRNPWRPDCTPGGSSGGSAAAVAAGLAPIATATDGGGSIRIPAAFCGLAGIKPTNGLLGRDPLPSWIDFSTDGPFATTVDDLQLLLDVEAGPVPGDPSALPYAPSLVAPPGRDRPSRVFASERMADWGPLPASVTNAFEVALEALERDLGLVVERIGHADIFTAGNIDDDWFLMATVEQAYELGRETIEREKERFTDVFAYCMEQGLAYTAEEYATLRRRRFVYVRELDELLGSDALLATPTLCVEEQSAEGRVPGHNGIGTPAWVYNTQAQNLTGHPAITLPAGILPSGLPFGLELTGPRFRDDLLISVGRVWEEAHPWPRVAPGYDEFLAT
jgi:Asp-tRNA(Asn)/Glu-tRNA(Gln) amidotransferase A subunit family amidase